MTMDGTGTARQSSLVDEDAMSSPEFPRRWTDTNGQVWEEVSRPDPLGNVSDATLGAALAVVLLVPGIALLVGHAIWGPARVAGRPGRRRPGHDRLDLSHGQPQRRHVISAQGGQALPIEPVVTGQPTAPSGGSSRRHKRRRHAGRGPCGRRFAGVGGPE